MKSFSIALLALATAAFMVGCNGPSEPDQQLEQGQNVAPGSPEGGPSPGGTTEVQLD